MILTNVFESDSNLTKLTEEENAALEHGVITYLKLYHTPSTKDNPGGTAWTCIQGAVYIPNERLAKTPIDPV